LKSEGLKTGYPLAIFQDGTVETAGTEGEDFLNQLQQHANNRFWADLHPDRYAQYQRLRPPAEQAKRFLKGWFRLGGQTLEQGGGGSPSDVSSQEKISN